MNTRTAIAAVCLAAAPIATLAEWPTTPDESITVGPAPGTFFGPRQTLAVTPGSTWIAWQDSICGGFDDGAVRLSRLSFDGTLTSEAGTAIQPDNTCGFVTPPLVAALAGESAVAVTRSLSDLSTLPLNRYDADGAPAWSPGFLTLEPAAIQQLITLPSGDLLVASVRFGTIQLDRLAPDGSPVWPEPTLYPSPSGANFEIRALIPDGQAGFYLVWDAPLSYTRQAYIQRFDAQGQPRWEVPVVPMQRAPEPGISRHTAPTAVATTGGRLVYIWTRGFESGTTPAPIRYQIINPDGSLKLPIEGARLTDSPERQFDPIAVRNAETGEIDIVFRAGLFEEQSVRAQRLDADGNRLWDDQGIVVAPIVVSSSFDAAHLRGELHAVTVGPGGPDSVTLEARQIADTQAVRGPWPVARTAAAFSIVVAEDPAGMVVTWQQAGPSGTSTPQDTLNATRVNPAGRLGAPPCNRADLTAPYYILDLADVQAFIPAFLTDAPEADLADPSGVFDLGDVQAFVDAFAAGCS
jgi:hypothetical protein